MSREPAPFDVDNLDAVIIARRSTLRCDEDRVIPAATIDELCALGTWAPCHKQTWPWKFASFTGASRAELGASFVVDMITNNIGDAGKHDKTAGKYLRTPNVLVVGCAANEHPTMHDENRDAVAAAIQNIMLGATARGISTFWATAPVMSGRSVLRLCGFDPDDRIIGVLSLGYANAEVAAPRRPPAVVRHVT